MRRMILDALGMPAVGPLLAQRWRRNGTSHRVRNSSGERTKVDDCCCDGTTTHTCDCCSGTVAADVVKLSISGIDAAVTDPCTLASNCASLNGDYYCNVVGGAGSGGCTWSLDLGGVLYCDTGVTQRTVDIAAVDLVCGGGVWNIFGYIQHYGTYYAIRKKKTLTAAPDCTSGSLYSLNVLVDSDSACNMSAVSVTVEFQ